ncbi:flagellar hook-length control protein FliK [Rhizobium lemnae]|uniref:Flagellar hook-length control protein FliK n=1 Tax=Rhizobium lemnae TaxID=1214924 RepID=A0ABV8EBC6_9HYPH|nr:flagellar hook-length control protein FliK [Rhizobium lemnae]MCJ8506418.1 flagellar hook-length control protein FliK [Rhizobium lemnae]
MITSALNLGAPASGAAPQDAVQGRGGKEKSDGFGNALSSVSQRESRGQGEDQEKTLPSVDLEADAEVLPPTPVPRVRIADNSAASAVLRLDLTIAGKLSGKANAEVKADDDREMGTKSLQIEDEPKTQKQDKAQKAEVKAQHKSNDDDVLSDKTEITADHEPSVQKTDVEKVDPKTIATDANSVLSLLSGSVEVAAVAHSSAKITSGKASGSGDSNDGNRDVAPVQKQGATGDTLMTTELDVPVELPETGAGGGERTFRFAGPRGSSMDMIISTGADGKTTFETGRSGNGGAEQVTVLDARRFLGFGTSQNATALTTAIAQDQDWAAAMHPSSALSNAAAQSSTGNVVNTLKLQMTPIDLGSVTATLKLVGEQLSVHLTVETRAAHSQLTSDSSGILDALRSQGFAVDQVTVTITPTAQSDNSQQSNDAGQRGAMAGQQGNGSAGQGQGQGQGQQSGRAGVPFMTGNDDYETAADPRSGAASGRDVRAGDIYL